MFLCWGSTKNILSELFSYWQSDCTLMPKAVFDKVFFFPQPHFHCHYPLFNDAIATQLSRPRGAHFLEYKNMRYVLSVSGSHLHLHLHSIPRGDVRFVFRAFLKAMPKPNLNVSFFFFFLPSRSFRLHVQTLRKPNRCWVINSSDSLHHQPLNVYSTPVVCLKSSEAGRFHFF